MILAPFLLSSGLSLTENVSSLIGLLLTRRLKGEKGCRQIVRVIHQQTIRASHLQMVPGEKCLPWVIIGLLMSKIKRICFYCNK